MDTDVIYMLAHDPTSHTYLTFNEDGSFQEHYSLKRARYAKPDAPMRLYVAKEA